MNLALWGPWQWIVAVIGWVIMAGVTAKLWNFVADVFETLEGSDDAYGWAIPFWPAMALIMVMQALMFGVFGGAVSLAAGLRWLFNDAIDDIGLWLERRKERAERVMDEKLTARLTAPPDPYMEQARKEVEDIAPGDA